MKVILRTFVTLLEDKLNEASKSVENDFSRVLKIVLEDTAFD